MIYHHCPPPCLGKTSTKKVIIIEPSVASFILSNIWAMTRPTSVMGLSVSTIGWIHSLTETIASTMRPWIESHLWSFGMRQFNTEFVMHTLFAYWLGIRWYDWPVKSVDHVGSILSCTDEEETSLQTPFSLVPKPVLTNIGAPSP
jgi:hypothetical protein